ncbi:MAG: hypothetical protein Q8S73_36805 [Deltaproteobacteria bacterium]|nr:hypothetical protein [Myxococcales bacterium]MDP3219720.1 hypothetical protein [Deltaproteobacteria bacterium]
MVAVAAAQPHTAATLAEAGVRITLVSAGLAAARVDVVAPPSLAPVVRTALQWRIEAMRAQLRAARGLGAVARTPVAVLDLRLPMAPTVRWRGLAESHGRTYWQERTAQRPEGGWCGSCGEAHATRGETGDCVLCNAARVAALRAEGLLPAATPVAVPPVAHVVPWQRAAEGLRAPTPAPRREPWTCPACGAENVGRRPDVEGCGPCTNRQDATLDMSRLGRSAR